MKKYYTCKYARAFKEIMLKYDNLDLLKYYLEFILEVKIKDMKINNVELLNGNINTKGKRLDLFLETDKGKINVEVNAENKDYVHPRNLGYICNIYQNHILVGKKYAEETKIIQINFSYGLNKKKAIYKYEIKNEENEKFVSNFEIYEINMEYFMKNWYNKNQDEINKYKYFIMLNLEKEDLEILSKKDKVVRKYMEDLNIINDDPIFIQHMTEEDDREAICIAKYKKEFIEEGYEQGMEKGIKQGIKKGKKEGIEEGQKKEKIEIAKNMLEQKIDIDVISKVTGLNIEKILDLK